MANVGRDHQVRKDQRGNADRKVKKAMTVRMENLDHKVNQDQMVRLAPTDVMAETVNLAYLVLLDYQGKMQTIVRVHCLVAVQ
ncbi:unnamed protein product [Onchocerca flexuosa]|uniref:Phospholipid-transporting ATPase IIB n=1 Tax=Onchocerca flexuosa TaxID=387005 RepID=A0A183HTK7_9BILA|nr:unnamed protein product [Onchocerca flexuosa]